MHICMYVCVNTHKYTYIYINNFLAVSLMFEKMERKNPLQERNSAIQ